MARCQAALSAGNFPDVVELMNLFSAYNFSVVTQRPANVGDPQWILLRSDEADVLFVAGVQSLFQAQTFINAYDTGITRPLPNGPQADAYRLAYAIVSLAGWASATGTKRIDLVGHSYGGAVALNILGQAKNWNSIQDVYATTFGSPSPGTYQFCQELPTDSCTRVFFMDDPVPLIPPSLNNNSYVPMLVNRATYDSYNQFGQPSGGVALMPDGSTQPATAPGASLRSVPSNLAAWLFSVATGRNNPHSMSRYNSVLGYFSSSYVHAVPAATPAPVRVTPSAIQPPAATATTSMIVGRTNIQTANNLSAQAAPAPGTAIDQPEEKIARVVRIGRLYAVLLNGLQIATTTNRRQAHSIARNLNSHLRTLQNTANWDANALWLGYGDYVAACAKPDGEFNPPMNNVADPVANLPGLA